MIVCRHQHIKPGFVETYASWQGLKPFIEFCEQDSLYVPNKYNITQKINYCHTAMETI